VRTRVRFDDAEIRQQQCYRFGGHRGATVCMKRKLVRRNAMPETGPAPI
jgi:hypothetical protein